MFTILLNERGISHSKFSLSNSVTPLLLPFLNICKKKKKKKKDKRNHICLYLLFSYSISYPCP